MQIDIYYSYACRESYLVFEWLNQVKKNGYSIDINWHPFAIQLDDEKEYWNRSWVEANSELRGFIAAESAKRQSIESFRRFHNALEEAVHEKFLELGDESTLIDAARKAGLDLEKFKSDWHNKELIQIIKDSHEKAILNLKIYGTPSIVFSNGHAFHLELNEIPLENESFDFFETVKTLATKYSYIKQLKQL